MDTCRYLICGERVVWGWAASRVVEVTVSLATLFGWKFADERAVTECLTANFGEWFHF